MSLVLAIEADRRQATLLASIGRRIGAELVIAPSAERGLEAIDGRVPDLILTSALLSPRDDAAIAARLRELDTAASHVQMLTIPLLAKSSHKKLSGGLLGKLRGAAATPDGCDPALFAEQVVEYLDRAAAERRADEEARALAAQDLEVMPQTQALVVEQPSLDTASFVEDPPLVESVQAAESLVDSSPAFETVPATELPNVVESDPISAVGSETPSAFVLASEMATVVEPPSPVEERLILETPAVVEEAPAPELIFRPDRGAEPPVEASSIIREPDVQPGAAIDLPLDVAPRAEPQIETSPFYEARTVLEPIPVIEAMKIVTAPHVDIPPAIVTTLADVAPKGETAFVEALPTLDELPLTAPDFLADEDALSVVDPVLVMEPAGPIEVATALQPGAPDDPVAPDDPLEITEMVAAIDSIATVASIAAVEPIVAAEPIAAVDPLSEGEPSAAVEPVAALEPIAAMEPVAAAATAETVPTIAQTAIRTESVPLILETTDLPDFVIVDAPRYDAEPGADSDVAFVAPADRPSVGQVDAEIPLAAVATGPVHVGQSPVVPDPKADIPESVEEIKIEFGDPEGEIELVEQFDKDDSVLELDAALLKEFDMSAFARELEAAAAKLDEPKRKRKAARNASKRSGRRFEPVTTARPIHFDEPEPTVSAVAQDEWVATPESPRIETGTIEAVRDATEIWSPLNRTAVSWPAMQGPAVEFERQTAQVQMREPVRGAPAVASATAAEPMSAAVSSEPIEGAPAAAVHEPIAMVAPAAEPSAAKSVQPSEPAPEQTTQERRSTPPAANAPTRTKKRAQKNGSTAPDEWGLFDPNQCGFAALLEKLDELDDASDDAA